MKTEKKLDRLATLQGKLRRLNADREKAISLALGGRAKAAFDKISKQFKKLEDALTIEAAELEVQIKDEVTQAGQTVSGKNLMAVFVSGKASWNTKMLDGFALIHPEIEKCKSMGEPFVNIRRIKK
jgi:hypothetical protein